MDGESGEPHPPATGAASAVDVESLAAYVLAAASRYRSENDIVARICERSGWDWNRAREFYDRTIEENATRLQQSKDKVQAIAGVLLCFLGAAQLLAVVGINSYCSGTSGVWGHVCETVSRSGRVLALLAILAVAGFGSFLTGAVGIFMYIYKRSRDR